MRLESQILEKDERVWKSEKIIEHQKDIIEHQKDIIEQFCLCPDRNLCSNLIGFVANYIHK